MISQSLLKTLTKRISNPVEFYFISNCDGTVTVLIHLFILEKKRIRRKGPDGEDEDLSSMDEDDPLADAAAVGDGEEVDDEIVEAGAMDDNGVTFLFLHVNYAYINILQDTRCRR